MMNAGLKSKHTPLPVHRCPERACCFFGQPTSKSCRCHKTTEQLLIEQRDELLAALQMFVAWDDDTHDTSPSEQHRAAMKAARAVVAKAEA